MEKILFIELGLPQNNWLALVGVAPMRVAKILINKDFNVGRGWRFNVWR